MYTAVAYNDYHTTGLSLFLYCSLILKNKTESRLLHYPHLPKIPLAKSDTTKVVDKLGHVPCVHVCVQCISYNRAQTIFVLFVGFEHILTLALSSFTKNTSIG